MLIRGSVGTLGKNKSESGLFQFICALPVSDVFLIFLNTEREGGPGPGARGPGPPTISRGITINNLNNLNCV